MSRSRARAPSPRQLRVGEVLRHALSMILAEGSIRDPDLSGASITVTEVRVSPDLRNATAFVMPLGGADLARRLAALRRAAQFLRGEIARRVNLRFTPRLTFEADRSFDEAGRIEELLRGERVRRDVADDEGEAGHGS